MNFSEFEKEFISTDVKHWLDECKTLTTDEKKCNVLRYVSEANDHAHVEYLLYVPGAGYADDILLDTENHLGSNKDVFVIDIYSYGFFDFGSWETIEHMGEISQTVSNQPYLYHITYDSAKMPPENLQIIFNGHDMEFTVTDTLLPFYSEERKDLYYEEMQKIEPVTE